MSRLKDLAIIATACATLAAGAAWWYDKQERHEAQCAPIRADAKAAGKIDTSPVEPPDPGNFADLQRSADEHVGRVRAYMAASAARNTVIAAHASCFEEKQVTRAKVWLRENERRDDDVQQFWYCWDSGAPRPHRLGHPVSGDHKCTWGELRQAGVVTN